MTNKYLKPMLDVGSPRVFNCNEMTRSVLRAAPEAPLFFQNKPLNSIVLVKDAVPEGDRPAGSPAVGTKLYFPFNENNIYEGGRTIFLHERGIDGAIKDYCGEGGALDTALVEDMRKMRLMDRLPSLDPFLLKDAFRREKIVIDDGYFEVTDEAWGEIESFMLQRFEPLIAAAFPDAQSSNLKARQLIDKIWEAKDIEALLPLIDAFRLPRERALDIFSSWKGIVYYSFQYSCEQTRFANLVRWVAENEAPPAGVTSVEVKELQNTLKFVKEQLRAEWQKTDDIVKAYQSSYDKMFKEKVGSTDFLNFLKGSEKIYWDIGNSLGKITHATYCWGVMTSRYPEQKVPWAGRQDIARLLSQVFESNKKTSTSMSWT